MPIQTKGQYRGAPTMDSIRRDCKRSGNLWEDKEFPAQDSSLFYSKRPPRSFTWLRPTEICDNPKMFIGGASRFDVAQGELGDCWLLASIACLTLHEHLLHNIVPNDQDFDSPDYCGAFRFRFWREGEWIEIIVDDRLPHYNDRLVFTHSATGNEFWSALLEKAYAKLFGSYEYLKGGQTSEGLVDFTGGLAESFDLHDANRPKLPENLFDILLRAQARMSMMACSIDADPNKVEEKLNNGLVKGHAYSITSLVRINCRGKDVELIRIRNPWGGVKNAEWTGRWSDSSDEWRSLSDRQKRDMGVSIAEDGEFYMEWCDFLDEYTRMEVCHLGVDAMDCIEADPNVKRWVTETIPGRWQSGATAGGCRNFKDTFCNNPQFRIKLEEVDDDGKTPLIVAVMQKGTRKKNKQQRTQMLTIGFIIYKFPEDDETFSSKTMSEKVPMDFFLYNSSAGRSDSFINSREIVKRFSDFEPGEYVIIPSTFNPNQDGEFIVRIYTEQAATASTIDVKMKIGKPQIDVKPPNQEVMKRWLKLYNNLAGDDNSIDAAELQELLRGLGHEFGADFEVETTRSLLSMFDNDGSGKISWREFQDLVISLMKWKGAFKRYDRDSSNSIDAYELRTSLRSIGYRIPDRIMSTLVARYSSKKLDINFPDFILCCARIKEAIEIFNETSVDDRIVCDMGDWVKHRLFV